MNSKITTRIKQLIIALCIGLTVVSCIPKKKLAYIQDKSKDLSVKEYNTSIKESYVIQRGDNLYIKITGLNEMLAGAINGVAQSDQRYMTNEASIYLNSYLVEDSGFVDLPIIGKINFAGLTLIQAKESLQNKVNEYLKGSSVVVKLANYNVTVLGEVVRPGRYMVYSDQLNIFQAVGLAGDLTEYGKRSNVMLVRQTKQGSSVKYIDLTDRALLESEYYYVMPNDIIYVQPMNAKAFGLRSFPVAMMLSTITTLILVLNFIN